MLQHFQMACISLQNYYKLVSLRTQKPYQVCLKMAISPLKQQILCSNGRTAAPALPTSYSQGSWQQNLPSFNLIVPCSLFHSVNSSLNFIILLCWKNFLNVVEGRSSNIKLIQKSVKLILLSARTSLMNCNFKIMY